MFLITEGSQKANVSFQTADHFWQSAANELKTEPETQLSVGTHTVSSILIKLEL